MKNQKWTRRCLTKNRSIREETQSQSEIFKCAFIINMPWRFCKSPDSLLFNFFFLQSICMRQKQLSFNRQLKVWGVNLEPVLEPNPGTQSREGCNSIQFSVYQLENCFHQGNWDPRWKQLYLVEENPLLNRAFRTRFPTPVLHYSL